MRHVYEVGDKLVHEAFGEGLVVDVRQRPFYDILEIAFADGVRKITSIHPQIAPYGSEASSSTATAVDDDENRDPAPEPTDETSPNGSAPAERGHEFDVAAFGEPDVVQLDQSSFAILDDPPPEGSAKNRPDDYSLRLSSERSSLNHGFERLISLESVRGVQRYQYQVNTCLKILREMNGRTLLADEVGLGKTIEAGLVMKEYVLRGLVKRCLVLVPASLVVQWREEMYQKFDIEFETYGKDTDWSKADYLIASLDTAKSARNRKVILEQNYDMVVVDEAHRLRNHQTLGWKFVDALSVKHILLLTATPVQNDLRELFNLVTLLKPGALGTYRAFRRAFMVRGDKRLPKNTRELARLLNKVMVRTTRSSTSIRFPDRMVETLSFELGPEERELYDAVSQFVYTVSRDRDDRVYQNWHFVLMVLQKEIGSSSFAAAKTLRKCLDDRHLGKHHGALERITNLAHSISANSKVEGLAEVLQRHPEDKIIVFTQFLETLEYVSRHLEARGVRVSRFHGGMSAADKEKAIDRFRRGSQVLVSSEAGGEGRNLQFCRVVVNYDLPWNPMRVEQRIGRVHRLGQKRDVFVYNFTARDTVESYVLELLLKKIRMFELVIGEMGLILGPLEDQGGFENRVFQIWTSTREADAVRRKFDEYGEELDGARRRYEKVQELDRAIFESDGGSR